MSSVPQDNFFARCRNWITGKWNAIRKNVFTDRMIWCCVMATVICVCSDKIFSLWIGWFGARLDQFYEIIVDRKILLAIAIGCTLWIGIFKMMRAARRSTSISANDYIVYRNYALRPVEGIFESHFRSHPGLMKGHNLERLKDVFDYTITGDQEVDMDNAEDSDVRIRSIFENYENMRNIIFKWFKGSKEEKNKLIKDLHIEKR